ncbi:MAG: S8 family serine peptidase, partial [Bacteroidota bacterium]
IKPEVVAPGVTTRSARAGGGYTWFAGTSMATPHVAGAIMLLKEAFPTLTGEEIKTALYVSARDLGPIGEDNAYGNGIINVKDAFEALTAVGNQPVSVPIDRNPGLSGQTLQGFCGEPVQVDFTLHNYGQGALDSVYIEYQWSDESEPDTLVWQGNLPIESELSLSLPIRNLDDGFYEVRLDIVSVQGVPDYFFLDNLLEVDIMVQPATSLSANADPVCMGSSALLSAAGLDSLTQVRWYDRPTGGQVLGRTAQWVSPALTEPDTFYAEAATLGRVGKLDNSLGAGTYAQATTGRLLFNCAYPTVLEAVTVYGLIAGEQRIVLRDRDGQELAARNVPLGTGRQRVALGFSLPRAEGLSLELDESSTGGLYYNIDSAQFPYDFQGIVEITGAADGATPRDFYYHFYNWELSVAAPCARIQVPIAVENGEALVDFQMNADIVDLSQNPVVQFRDSSEGAVAWQWAFGDGGMANISDPSHSYQTPGQYEVALQITNADGCTAAKNRSLEVFNAYPYPVSNTALLADKGLLHISPNPASRQIRLHFSGHEATLEHWYLRDLQGRVVAESHLSGRPETEWKVTLPQLAQGLYLFQIIQSGQQLSRPLYIQQP